MWAEDTNIGPKRSLILAGGGMRVAYQAGVIMALEEAGIRFSHVDGTSGGIFNAAMLASGLTPKDIASRWRSLNIRNFVSGRRFRDYLKPFAMSGYADADNIRLKVFPHLGINLNKIRSNNDATFSFNLCNFSNKTIEAISHDKVTEDHLIAGVSLPMMMPALKIGNDWYTDAVWIKDAHLMEAVRQGAEELWLVWIIGNSPSYLAGAFNQYVHMIEMSANGALWEEFEQIRLINQAVANRANSFIRLKVLKPPRPLPLDPDLFFNKINARELINMGYAAAKRDLQEQPDGWTSMNPQSTKTADVGQVLSFRAKFQGKLLYGQRLVEVKYYVYVRFISSNLQSDVELYASLYLGQVGEEIATYNNTIKTLNSSTWLFTSKLMLQGQEQQVTAEIPRSPPIDFVLGFAMKRCRIDVANEEGVWLKGVLYQTAFDRIKASYFTSLRDEGKQGSLRKRFLMLSKFIRHEV